MNEERDEKLWEVWVNKEIDMSFEEFRKKSTKKPKPKDITEGEEKEIMRRADNILKMTRPKEKVGEND